jgi:subtilisin-like proprotein convertase family protein
LSREVFVRKGILLPVVAVLVTLTATLLPSGETPVAADGPTTFSNTAAITIPASGTSGPASPYPSNILVSGMGGTITKVTVTITGITHTCTTDLDLLLVGPGGQDFLMMGDVDGVDCAHTANNATITLDDSAASALPAPVNPLASGTFRPASYTFYADTFDAPAPAVTNRAAPEGAATFASIFNGLSPNGTWSLYVMDNAPLDAGSFSGGWSITITTTAPTPTFTATTTPTVVPTRTRVNVGGAVGPVVVAAAGQAQENRERVATAAAAAQPTVPPPSTGTGIMPPNTGDGGLAGNDGAAWLPVAVGAAGLALAALRLVRR